MGMARTLGILRFAESIASRHPRWVRLGWMIGLIALSAFLAPVAVNGADVDACRRMFIAGRYDECIEAAAAGIRNREYGEAWPALKAQAELMTGRPADANATLKAGLERYSWSVQLRMLSHHAARCEGDRERAEKQLREIEDLAGKWPWRYTDVDDLLALGEAGLISGADPKDVLEGFYEKARAQSPSRREPVLAIGQLALDKGDHELAAETFAAASKRFPDDPDIHFGLARSLSGSEPLRATAALAATLKANPRHVPALLMQADQSLDAERYDEALALIERVLKTNSRETDAWAFRAVIAHLQNDPRGEAAFRAAGGAADNPTVDHLIGVKLSQKYRFTEGAAAQRRALAIDSKFVPARVQLAQDLLRLGEDDEAWKLAGQAHEEDGYHVANFNLLELKDRIAKFTTLQNDDFLVRMEAKEAAIYGQRVLRLLGRAKSTLCAKYGLDLKHRITVEIFPDENDFAVRTFGMPAGSGYLGVCFGKVITANSPASQKEHPANWESVLWHEFCHVVTLELTHNKMPRWLSEGISVYEERQENPAWGQRINPRYREMILAGELTPVSELSGAFLNASDPIKLQFAYYQSNLVVEHIVSRHGHDALKKILRDLGAGLPINAALDRHTDGLAKLEHEFAEFAKARAESLAPTADWEKPEIAGDDDFQIDRLTKFVAEHPNNVAALSMLAGALMEDRRFAEARKPLERLIEIDPTQVGGDNAYEMLARVHRETKDTAAEAHCLERYAAIDSSALPVYLRLMELHDAAGDVAGVARNVARAMAVNPLIPEVQRRALDGGEATGQIDEALEAGRALLVLDPDSAARTHYRLARLLHSRKDPTAKMHLLKSLEEAPRYRAAQRLLLELQ